MNKNQLFNLFVVVSVVFTLACNRGESGDTLNASDLVSNPISAESADMSSLPKIDFEKTEHDFGRMIQGEKVTFGFKFTNNGGSDLLITSVNTSCGCTATSYPTKPIKSGQSGTIKITFDSADRKGYQMKSATILSNAQPNRTILKIKSMVYTPEEL